VEKITKRAKKNIEPGSTKGKEYLYDKRFLSSIVLFEERWTLPETGTTHSRRNGAASQEGASHGRSKRLQ
jgi:hypothetical protein